MDRLAASTEAKLVFPHGECVLTYEKLDTDLLTTSVGSDGSGATVVFIGTTRNSFQGVISQLSASHLTYILHREARNKAGIPSIQQTGYCNDG